MAMKRWLILMTKENLAKCESGVKTQTRRDSERLAGIKKGDQLYFRSNYKTTYATASGPYIAEEDAKWEDLQDINAYDCIREGIPDPGFQGSQKDWISATRGAFCNLWQSIYKREGVRWEDNPRVIKISFKKMTA